jgi:hypothetical protein
MFHKTLELPSPRVQELLVFHTDMRVSQPKLNLKNATKLTTFISLSPSLCSVCFNNYRNEAEIPPTKKNSEYCRNIETLLHLNQQLTLYLYKCLSHVLGKLLNDLAVYFFKHNKLFLILRFFFLQRTTSSNTLCQCYKLEL